MFYSCLKRSQMSDVASIYLLLYKGMRTLYIKNYYNMFLPIFQLASSRLTSDCQEKNYN